LVKAIEALVKKSERGMSFRISAPKGFTPSSPDFNNGHWKFPQQMGKAAGFVYLIHDKILDRFYIGKKHYRTPKGVETDWRKYTSSSNIVNALIESSSKDGFDFFCLEEYQKRGAVGYAETWSLCYVEAPTTEKWYNARIEKVSWRVSETITQRHKDRLTAILSKEKPDV